MQTDGIAPGKAPQRAVFVVVFEAVAEPQNASHAEILGKLCLDCGAIHFRVAIGVQQALLSGYEQTRAVGVDGPPFQDPVCAAQGEICRCRQPCPDGVITGKVVFPAPEVEAKVDGSALAFVSDDDRCGIAQPDVPK